MVFYTAAAASGRQSDLGTYAMFLIPFALLGLVVGLFSTVGSLRVFVLGVLGSVANIAVLGLSVLRLAMLA